MDYGYNEEAKPQQMNTVTIALDLYEKMKLDLIRKQEHIEELYNRYEPILNREQRINMRLEDLAKYYRRQLELSKLGIRNFGLNY